jgi:hypothetical protein
LHEPIPPFVALACILAEPVTLEYLLHAALLIGSALEPRVDRL